MFEKYCEILLYQYERCVRMQNDNKNRNDLPKMMLFQVPHTTGL